MRMLPRLGALTAALLCMAPLTAQFAASPPALPSPAAAATTTPSPGNLPITFSDVTSQLGIHWKHQNGATAEKYLIETVGGGGAFLDYDRDGRLDIFLVNSGCHQASVHCLTAGNALYHQNSDGTFTDVTRQAGVGRSGYGMGVAVGDYDNDGYPDIYVTAYGRNTLYHNNRNGSFTDVTEKSGVAAAGWSTSAAFFDYNHDGLPDLYVGRYLQWDYQHSVFCGERRPGYRSYCHPSQFPPVTNILYRNNGDGSFTDVTRQAGLAVAGKTLGVVAFDYNRDGWLDLYVANDSVPNFLFRNNKDGAFSEIGLVAEVAYGASGKAQSGMGTDAADLRGDGLPDLFVTNIDFEPNTLFRNNGDDTFNDDTVIAGMGTVALLYSGFGTRFLDYNNDGLLDIFVANGHPLDNVQLFHDGVTPAERPFLLENSAAGRFQEVAASHGDALAKLYNGRGLAAGDFDNDGDTDLLLIQNGGPPVLLRNDGGNHNAWIGFALTGSLPSSRDAVGAVVTITAGGRRQSRQLVGGGSYGSAHDPRLLFGLESAENVEKIEVRWPDGATTSLRNLAARHYYPLREPATPPGKVGAR